MPRSVNIANLQNAFAQLGQSNARIANMEMAEREKERQRRAQMLAMIGGAVGGSVGGPAGAQAGSMIGASLAGSPSSYQAGASLGTAIANQQRQGERESALMAFQGIPEEGTQPPAQPQQRALQPLQETEEIEQAPQSPLGSLQQPFVAGPEQPSYSPTTQEPIIPQQAPQEEEQGFLGTLMNLFGGQGESPQVQPTQQVQQAQQSQLQPIVQGPPIIPISQQPTVQQPILRQQQIQQQGIQFDQTKPLERTFGRIAQQANQNYQDQLNILRDPRLFSSPELLMMQQRRVDQARIQAQQAQTNLARHQFLQQEALQKRIQKEQLSKQPLYNIGVGNEIVGTGLNINEAREMLSRIPKELNPVLTEVGKGFQPTSKRNRIAVKGLFTRITGATSLEEVDNILIDESTEGLESFEYARLQTQADKVKYKLSNKELVTTKKKISGLTKDNYTIENAQEIRNEIDSLEDSGLINAKSAQETRERLLKKENNIQKIRGSRKLTDKQVETFSNTIELQDAFSDILKHERFFKNIAFERVKDKVIAKATQNFGGDRNTLQEINSAIARLQLTVGNDMVKGVISEKDQERINEMLVSLDTAPESARRILGGLFENAKDRLTLFKDNLKKSKDFAESFEEKYKSFLETDFLKRSPNTLNIQGTSPNNNLTLAEPKIQPPIQITAENINSLKAGDTVLNSRGKPVVLTQEALNRLLGK